MAESPPLAAALLGEAAPEEQALLHLYTDRPPEPDMDPESLLAVLWPGA